MIDRMNPTQRKACMARIRGCDTGPERSVEALLKLWGFPYIAQARGFPGRPDFFLSTLGLALFVHGCFWHRHNCPEGAPWPKQNAAFWRAKLIGNQLRDYKQLQALKALGWRVAVIWECETQHPAVLRNKLLPLLLYPGPSCEIDSN